MIVSAGAAAACWGKEVLGAIEVLEPMLTEIPERDVTGQLVGDQLARGT